MPLEGKEQLQNELNNEQYQLITDKAQKKYEVKFKLIETINAFIHKDNYKTKR